ncbi:XRE family transcriptional regulator [Lysinibacter cavernae]|uniref:Transcriptional regulator with XRE-family HTH domain n=1 Tax=Lysinibacter cavernae TaxID=1640652 RepID=A0A7X5TRX2_9MICO|nr:XRE family transcriptional regulator [Lysinibacter cavernae]NIH52150.1 transcriptional regulator with XRE-family HTH domain [Lysinibacter cavernae]
MTPSTAKTPRADLLILGKRLRFFRVNAGLTLEQLGERLDVAASQLSLIENGRREPKLSLIQNIAHELGIELAELLSSAPPDKRSALEIELDQAQHNPAYASLGLPVIRGAKSLPDDALESLVGLHREIERRERAAIATPEEARRANTESRMQMRERDNYLPDIEDIAEEMLKKANHTTGALTHRTVAIMAEQLGFTLIYVDDLPHSTRSVTDLKNGRIYLPPASIPGGHGLRSLALQAMAHAVLGHDKPASYTEFLQQRLEINYFAAACLIPQGRAVEFLGQAKKDRNLAIEDFRDAFGVTHESAAQRFTNLATAHLDLTVHFMRVNDDGSLMRGYENDGVPLPTDASGTIEGQVVCKRWGARTAFDRTNRTSEFYQYTDTPAGTFWCTVQTGSTETEGFSISFGVPFDDAKWFRGRDTSHRTVSLCPDPSCCRRPAQDLTERWADQAWPSARMHAHVLSPLPQGSFPGVDDTEVYEFLSRHAE